MQLNKYDIFVVCKIIATNIYVLDIGIVLRESSNIILFFITRTRLNYQTHMAE